MYFDTGTSKIVCQNMLQIFKAKLLNMLLKLTPGCKSKREEKQPFPFDPNVFLKLRNKIRISERAEQRRKLCYGNPDLH